MKKKLLWIIAAVLVVAAGLAAVLLLPKDQPAPAAAAPEVKLCWNVDRLSYQPDTGLTRIKNGDYYRATFAIDGQQVDLFFDNYAMIEYADTLQYMGIEADENGVVQKVLKIDEFTGGLACLNAYVEQVEQDQVLCNTSLNFRELPIKLKINENTQFYYMDEEGGPLVGMPTEPQRGARITAIQDHGGYVICAYVEPPFEEKPVYYNKTRMYDSASKLSTRDSDALGVYTITFAVDGELVDLKCKDQKLVNTIDSYATMCMSLGFDEEGYINNVAGAWHATGTWSDISWCYVTEIGEDHFIAQNSKGKTFTGYLADNVKIFHVDKRAENFGEYTELQIGDRVHCSCNKGGDINVIFVNQRTPVMDIYWNVCRMYHSEAKKTNRVADKDGWYYFTVAVNGQQKDVKTSSYDLANKIDSNPAKCFALTLEGDVITDVIDPWSTRNGSTWGSWVDITDIDEDGNVTAVKISGGKVTDTLTGKLADDFKAYNVTGDALFIGVETQLREGDKVHALKNSDGTINTAFVVSRPMDCELYFNLSRYYDSATKSTTRTPNAEGYYEFTLAVNGSQVTLKTKSKDIATQIDKVATRAVGLKVRGNEIVKVYNDNKVAGYTGGRKAAWYTLTALDGKKLTAENKNVTDVDYGWIFEGTMTANCPVYNCSTSTVNFRGEATQLKLGDTIMCMLDGNGKIVLVYVVGRKDDVPIYWNVDKMWDSANKVSTRTPDEEGWYWFKMAIDGQHVMLKTNDKTIVDTIDGRVVDCIGLVTDGDRITRTVMPWKTEATIGGDFGSWTNVVELGENGLIKTVKVSTGSDNGKVFTGTMQENCQVFDVSSGAAMEGELSSLRLGDLIHGLADKDGNPRIIYIISRAQAHSSNHCTCGGNLDAHAKTKHNEADGACTDQVWLPIASQSQWNTYTVAGKLKNNRRFEAQEVNIYLSADITMPAILEVYPGQTVNICLNGHTLTTVSGQRFGNVAGGTLNICDCGTGGKLTSSYSTVLYAYADGRINLYGGTITTSATTTTHRWGLVYLGNDAVSSMGLTATKSDMAIYGGCVDASKLSMDKVCGAASGQDSMGGAIWGFASTTSLSIHGGTVKGATITSGPYGSGSSGTYVKGGAIALTGGSTRFTMTGGEVLGGSTPKGRGGSIYLAGKGNTITGGKISGGTAAYGGSIFCYSGDLTIGGNAVVEGGKAATNGGNIYLFAGTLTLEGNAQIDGGSTAGSNSGGNIYLRWNSGSVMHMNGGTVSGGVAGDSAKGECGNFYVGYNATLNIGGGTITGGRAKNGGNVGCFGTVNMTGGTVTGGNATSMGGNFSLYQDDLTYTPATLTVTGGVIENGTAGSHAGNIRMGKNCKVILNGGTVTGGTAGGNGGNIYVGPNACTLELISGTISAGNAVSGGGIYGAASAVITGSENIQFTENQNGDLVKAT